MTAIQNLVAREVLDSRGKPTLEVEVHTANGMMGRAIVPSGASTGAAEALELRDGDAKRYDGQGVRAAVNHVQRIVADAIRGMSPEDQFAVDRRLLELDGTSQKSRLGGNTLLGVSLAVAHAAAAVQRQPLFRHLHALYQSVKRSAGAQSPVGDRPKMPVPMTNMISGGLHAGGNLDFQDVLIIPTRAPDYATGLEWIVRVYRRLGTLLQDAGYEGRLVGDEGGYGPRLGSNQEAVEIVTKAIAAAGLEPGRDMHLALDVAATHFHHEGSYRLKSESNRRLSAIQMVDLLNEWIDQFPIRSIEDGLAENDWDGWRLLTQRLGQRVQLVGDDLFATNVERLKRGIELGAANSALIKVNQIGTLSETLETVMAAREAGYTVVVSARSGETEDTTIADLAVAVAAEQIKIGSIVRSERLAKYNQLLRIQEQLESGGG